MTTIFERFLSAINHQETFPVPVVGWDNAVPITRLAGIKAEDYYRDPAVKMSVQKMVIDEFPQIRWVPGFHADFGVAIEPSAFGCEIDWFADESPYAQPFLTSIDQIATLSIPDPEKDGLMPEALAQYRYMWEHIDRHYIEEYGYLEGFALSLGPLEIAASLRGYENFLLDFYDHPAKVHQLLEITTEAALRWLKAQEKVNGQIRFLVLVDHLPGNISLALTEEYAFPYFKRIFDEYPEAVRVYHNEGSSNHYLSKISEFGAQVFHCGNVDLEAAKRTIGDRVCLMGNLDANSTLLNGNPDEVIQVCLEKLRIAAGGGGYLLCTGGAMAPGTPRENLLAMIDASQKFEDR